MGGIYSCLNRSSNELNVVISYDLPLIPMELILYLLAQIEGYEIVVPYLDEGRPEPLCAIYRKNSCQVFKNLIDRKEYAVHKAFSRTRTNLVKIGPFLSFYRPDIFININREEDLGKVPGGIS
jgi:molybdopterin-guanine dinucleotide biosynthesis protein A